MHPLTPPPQNWRLPLPPIDIKSFNVFSISNWLIFHISETLRKNDTDSSGRFIGIIRETRMVAYKLELEFAFWDSKELEKEAGDPFKTLSIDRINYYTSESKLRRELSNMEEDLLSLNMRRTCIVSTSKISLTWNGYCTYII